MAYKTDPILTDMERKPEGPRRTAELSASAQPFVDAQRAMEPFVDAQRAMEAFVDAQRAMEPFVDAQRAMEPFVDAQRAMEAFVDAQRAMEPFARIAREDQRIGDWMRAHDEAMAESVERVRWQIRTVKTERGNDALRQELAEVKELVKREVERRLSPSTAPTTSLKTWLFAQGMVQFPRRPGEQVWSHRGECWCCRLAREAKRAGFLRASASTIKTYLHRGNSGHAR
jgi:hypothetical protein